MAVFLGKAPGKIILFGEHAVVYGQPAIAIPVTRVKSTTRIYPDLTAPPGQVRIQALDIGLEANLSDLSNQNPLAAAIYHTLEELQVEHIPALTLQITSTIPIAAGMGSGAAVTVSIIRALSGFLGHPLPDPVVAALSYQVEKIHHGNPSGIDNNVVTYEKPVFFRREHPIQFLDVEEATHWLIADCGEKTPTRETVSDVGKTYAAQPVLYEEIFNNIGAVTQKAREALIKGDLAVLGQLLNENQALLQSLNVSSPALENLIQVARNAGAAGAKLSGGGRGGNIIALAAPSNLEDVKNALVHAGAVNVISTQLSKDVTQ